MATDPLTPPDIDWTADGQPVSRTYGDVYFSREDGLAEARAVFLAGCGLPEAWSGRRHFTVAELGFGTGLNILALLELWNRTRPADGHLHIWSVEAHPLSAEALAASHSAWPELGDLSKALVAAWPSATPGLHRIDLPAYQATLDLALGEVAAMLSGWAGKADAWFLDGFAPASNPGMWSDEVLARVAAHSAPGARVATFTVAGQVRRGLAAGGFDVAKRPGHGRKRERLEAVMPGLARDAVRPQRVAVIGGGIAGASLVRAFMHLGLKPTLIEAEHPGAGASGAPAALVTPWVDAGLSLMAVLAAQAFHRASHVYRQEVPSSVLQTGVLRLSRDEADAARLAKVAGQAIWPADSLQPLSADAVRARLGEDQAQPGLWLDQGLVVQPDHILTAWLAGADRESGRVLEIVPGLPSVLRLDDGRELAFDVVVLATGWGSADLGVRPLSPVQGQVVWADGIEAGPATVWGPGYAVPTRTGTLIGATHDRGRTGRETDPDAGRLLVERLSSVRPRLAAALDPTNLCARAAVRATTPDHRPLCGALEPGVWALTGLGGRGFAWAPLLAEHLAAQICATTSPLSAIHIDLIAPRRRAADADPGEMP
ncbi:MAG: tRNA (5-methylaminomethyl-2-thiouridine)(34)-methyltransferase MnmD [Caulobacterales bacterium]|nr:tRNA (5-methylaminomethyl-2-thiouridine)(34)-methyltransferase MnmD [Caulobacterales bacterium]